MRTAYFTTASNDEDWLFPFGANIIAYSNTLSSVDDRITYGTIDAEYDWLRGPDYKVASFVGYNPFDSTARDADFRCRA